MAGTEAPRLRLITEPQDIGLIHSTDRPLLNPAFAEQVLNVTCSMSDEIPISSLVVYSDVKRRQIDMMLDKKWKKAQENLEKLPAVYSLELPQRTMRIEEMQRQQLMLRELPQSPDAWKQFVWNMDAPYKRVLIHALTGKLRSGQEFGGRYGWIESSLSVGDLREIEASDDFALDQHAPLIDSFLSRAF